MKKLITLFISLIFSFIAAQAVNIQSVQDGFWTDGATWSTGNIPNFGDTIVVRHRLELEADIFLANNFMIIEESGVICSAFYGISVDETSKLINNGTISVSYVTIYGIMTNNNTVVTNSLYVADKKKSDIAEYIDNGSTIQTPNLENTCPEPTPPENLDTLSEIAKDFIEIDEEYMEICDGESPEFPYSKARYIWENGAVNSDFTPRESDMYSVDIVSKLDGSRNRDSIYIKVIASGVSVPNIFTPNNDGVNDHFLRESFDLIEMNIYNRWGKSVLRSETPTADFTDVMDGNYYYTIYHDSKCIKQNPIKGWVVIKK